jgi:myo-inositol-1(or 4)-monophosphatase
MRDRVATWKAAGDPVTAADQASESFIATEIRRRFPNDAMISEEGTSFAGDSGFRWLADPLDGTLNFAHNIGPWAVSLAVLQGSEIVAGCITEGRSRDVFTASRSSGAQRNGRAVRVSVTQTMREGLAGFDCPYDMTARMRTTYQAVGELLRVSAALRCYGSCAVALCMIASGEIDMYAVEYGKPWDFAAGTLLVREAGGQVTTWSGRHYDLERDIQVLATNGVLHESVVEVLAPLARD